MVGRSSDPKVVHFFDCADVGKTLVKYGRIQGFPWWHRPSLPPSMRLGDSIPRNPALARTGWRVRRTVEALRADVMHVHFGTRGGVAKGRPVLPFVMHWHGTDIRTNIYNEKTRPNIQWGADHAAKVVYSTPDLREHAERVRPDALYLPIPYDISELPSWKPDTRPRVVFSSRWEESKGGAKQLDLLRSLRRELGQDVIIEGLDWGDMAPLARQLGARLVSRMPKGQYLRWMAGAHCVVGQSAGSIGTSELQALAMGAPVVMHVQEGFYPGSPVFAGATNEALVAQVLKVMEDPVSAGYELDGRTWAARYHSPEVLVPKLATIYRTVADG